MNRKSIIPGSHPVLQGYLMEESRGSGMRPVRASVKHQLWNNNGDPEHNPHIRILTPFLQTGNDPCFTRCITVFISNYTCRFQGSVLIAAGDFSAT